MRKLLAVLFLLAFAVSVRAAVTVGQTVEYTDPDLGLTVLGGTLELPGEGFWTVIQPEPGTGLRQVFVHWSEEAMESMRPDRRGGAARPAQVEYVLLALRDPAAKTTRATLKLVNRQAGRTEECAWDFSAPDREEADREVLEHWARARAAAWIGMARGPDAGILRHWLSVQQELYGAEVYIPDDDRRDRGQTADAFSVLGGRAAIRETLQMQNLSAAGQDEPSIVALSELRAVEVKSHPFDEMLGGGEGGRIALADAVPADRAFVYFSQPSAALPLLDQGVEFLYYGGSMAAESCVAYDLKARYLARLGVDEGWLKTLIAGGAVKELGVFVPDLFLIDGTEVTALARVPSAKLLAPALKLIGLDGLGAAVKVKPLKGGGEACWALDGDLLVAGTSRGEVESALALRKAGGDGSLGRSAEFRYMLTQLPVADATRMYAYLSDPFIRRLVGPEVKIGQLRRLRARAGLEAITAASLLWRLDGQPGAPDIARLVAKRYLDEGFAGGAYRMGAHGIPVSEEWGTAAVMKSLLANPVARATPSEAQAYAQYVGNYERFWRQYFDPISLRLGDAAGGRLELTTFILPLIDNSLYSGIKETLQHSENGLPLRVPALEPKPVMLLSLNLGPQVWGDHLKSFLMQSLARISYVEPKTFEQLGPAVHLAVQDADPILAFGSGDLLGAFGGGMMAFGGGREMMFIPLAISMLTRPCQLMIETRDPEGLLEVLKTVAVAAASMPGRQGRGGPEVTFYQVAGRDAWVCSIGMEGFVKIRLGLEIKGDYLVLNNLPWAPQPEVAAVTEEPLNAASLRVHPEAGVRQLASLFTTAAERERGVAMQGISYLYPFLAAGAKTVDEAAAQNAAWLGFRPEHPGAGAWTWKDGEVRSTVYGSPWDPVQPAYTPADRDFGTFRGVSDITVNLQFEDTGLRVVSGWAWNQNLE